MKRRDFIAGLASVAVFATIRPRSPRAQQASRPRRIAILIGVKEGDAEGIGRYAALVAGLKERGWIDGETAKLEVYWAGGSVARIREIVPGLVASAPDIIVSNGTAVTGELHKATQTIPTIFNPHRRSCRTWLHRKHVAPGRQPERLHLFRAAAGRQMV
jgi:ABC-type uncharacterized transport system substrate-binding protein